MNRTVGPQSSDVLPASQPGALCARPRRSLRLDARHRLRGAVVRATREVASRCGLVLLVTVTSVSTVQAQTTVVAAAKANDGPAVTSLIARGRDVNVPQPDGATSLHWASYWDSGEIAARLLDAGADVNAANDYGVTPLALACENASGAMVTRLLNKGANPNVPRSTGETPLMTCARTGGLAAVDALLAHGADANAAEPVHGQTALMWAAGEGHAEVVRRLLAGGAEVQVRTTGGYTALLIAARTDTPGLAGLLLNAGADVNAGAPDGTTPLLVATVRGHADLAIALLERGADPNASAGYTALHFASGAWHTELTGRLRGIETERDEEWRSMNEVRVGKVRLVEALLAHGADVDARVVRPPPQFGYASGRFRVGLVGATAFLLAAMDADVDAMRALAAAGADTQASTDEHTTPIMVAAGLGQVPAETQVTQAEALAAVRLALELGADVNQVNQSGRTALHGAAHIRSDRVVQVLVDHGARLNVEDERGITPLMIAEGGGHVLLPGLGGGTTSDLLIALGASRTAASDSTDIYSQGAIR
jgi:ankyrin repeat protein